MAELKATLGEPYDNYLASVIPDRMDRLRGPLRRDGYNNFASSDQYLSLAK